MLAIAAAASYLLKMRRRFPITIFFSLVLPLLARVPAHAQTDGEMYPIMRSEPWLAPKYKSPRGTSERQVVPRPIPEPRSQVTAPPPPIYVPQTGLTLPNMPTMSPSGPGGRETYQDRAARCAHQAGSYGALAGDRNSYIGSCINQ